MNLRFLWLIWLFLFVVPGVSIACTCSNGPVGACPGFEKGDVVFLGTAIAEEDATPPPAPGSVPNADDGGQPTSNSANAGEATSNANTPSTNTTPITRYRFRIDDRFAGPDASEIDVFSGGDDGNCGYRFTKGQQYIVYTQAEAEGRLFATICNGTRPAADGKALLPQLRAMRNGQRVASVFGVLRRADPPFLSPPDDPDDPLPNIALKLRSRDDRFSTSTGPNGIYSFYDVHAGEYNFTATLPAKMELTQKTLTGGLPPFKIPNGACYEYDVDALPTGHIRGSVIGPDGKPLGLASVELYRAGQYQESKPGLWAFQDHKGFFEFDHVGPGEYTLVFNRMNRSDPNSPFPRAFYPGTGDLSDAEPIALKDGQQLSKVNIKLKEGFPTRRIRVYVKWEHGKPPGDVTVMAKAENASNPAAQQIGDGVYEFTLLKSDRYMLSAWEDLLPQHAAARGEEPACVIPARIDTASVAVEGSDESTRNVTLIFPSVGCGKD